VSWRSLLVLLLFGAAMSSVDRQGFYFLVAAIGLVAILWLFSRLHLEIPRVNDLPVVAVGFLTIGIAVLYNLIIAPAVIHRLNGYWPDFSYQQLPLQDALNWTLARQAWIMLRAQTSYFFGNAPFIAIVLVLGVSCAASGWLKRRLASTLIIGTTVSASLFVLLAVMILRHPPVFTIPDHSFWYYTLTIHVVLLFVTSLLLASVHDRLGPWSRSAIALLIVVMIANNISHYSDQRETMTDSAKWFKNQHDHSERFVNDFEAMEGRNPSGPRSAASWLRVDGGSATIALPPTEQGFLEGVQAAHATLTGRHPLADAGGPYWSGVHDFLAGAASPLNDPTQLAAVVEGLQSIGVRRVIIDRKGFHDEALFSETADALVASSLIRQATRAGDLVTAELSDDPVEAPPRVATRLISADALHLTASQAADRLPLLLDGDPDTRWISGSRQTGDEWIRIGFDRPRDVVRVELVMDERSFGDYPRGLLIASEEAGQTKTLYQGNPLGAMMKGLLRSPKRASIEIALRPNHTASLVLRQTGQTRVWFWSIHELRLWER